MVQLQTASLSTSIANVTTSTLSQGSVSATSAVSQDQTDNDAVTASFNGLQSLLSSGTIAGSNVISFEVTAEGGDLPSTGVNVTLILAICIPLGVICNFYFNILSNRCYWYSYLL